MADNSAAFKDDLIGAFRNRVDRAYSPSEIALVVDTAKHNHISSARFAAAMAILWWATFGAGIAAPISLFSVIVAACIAVYFTHVAHKKFLRATEVDAVMQYIITAGWIKTNKEDP